MSVEPEPKARKEPNDGALLHARCVGRIMCGVGGGCSDRVVVVWEGVWVVGVRCGCKV